MQKLKYGFSILLLIVISSAKAQTSTVNTTVNNVLNAYFGIKNALAADNSATANQKAKDFTDALKQVNTGQLDAKQKTTWQTYAEKLRFDGEHISQSDKLAHQREHFESLSKNMLAVTKAIKANTAVVYEQYCPMKKALWLSETKTISNPYYGKEMSDCGTVKETLKAN